MNNISRYGLALIAVKILSLLVFVYFISSLSFLVGIPMNYSSSYWIYYGLFLASGYLICSSLFWYYAEFIARKIVCGSNKELSSTTKFNFSDLWELGLGLIGLYLVAKTLPRILGLFIQFFSKEKISWLGGYSYNLYVELFQIILAVILIFGARNIIRLIFKLKGDLIEKVYS